MNSKRKSVARVAAEKPGPLRRKRSIRMTAPATPDPARDTLQQRVDLLVGLLDG